MTALVVACLQCLGEVPTVAGPPPSDLHALAGRQDPEVVALVENILAYSGLEMNFILEEKPGYENASAVIRNGQRYLLYDPEWLREIARDHDTDWVRLGVLAHEIGHHVQGHTLDEEGSKPPNELQADRYAGFVLGLMGATLPEAMTSMEHHHEKASRTHPGKQDRVKATLEGWERARRIQVTREGKSKGCPVVRMDRPAKREGVFSLSLDGKIVALNLKLLWGHDDTVWGRYDANGAAIRYTGSIGPDGVLRLDEFSGCVCLSNLVLHKEKSSSIEAWTGSSRTLEGKTVEAEIEATEKR